MPNPPAPPSGGESFLTRKSIGGIPNWALLGVGGVAIYVLVGRKSASQATQTAQPSPYPAAYGGGTTPVYIVGNGAMDSGIGGASSGSNSGAPSSGVPTDGMSSTGGASAGSASVTPSAGPQYVEVSQQAALQDIQSGIPIYQSGASALQFAQQYGGPVSGINAGSYYQLSPTPQQVQAEVNQGYPIYVQSGAGPGVPA